MRILTLLLLLSFAAQGQQQKGTSVGYMETYDSLPVIAFQPSSQAVYDKCKKQAVQVMPAAGEQLVVRTKPGPVRLKKYRNDSKEEFKGYEYPGYLAGVKMHVVTAHHTAEHIGFSDLSLIDSLTGNWYNIVSIGDDAVEIPVPSPRGRYIIYFYNYVYERNSSFIGVLTVNRNAQPLLLLSEKTSAGTKAWGVEDIRWIDDQAFVVKAFITDGEGYERTRRYQYYLARLNR